MNLLLGDCLETLKTLPDNSIDSVVTDPPYGLSFMGNKWDYQVPNVEIWREVFRVLKPGGHVLSFGGTRTYHRMVVNIEEAGFEIRDQIQWLYGSGFPKSMDISKAIDKQAGATREVIGSDPQAARRNKATSKFSNLYGDIQDAASCPITAPSTDAAKTWQGWGTALKPANEPICLARKPISEKTVAQNVLKHGCGALNIDASRIGTEIIKTCAKKQMYGTGECNNGKPYVIDNRDIPERFHQGRWPANILLDESAAEMLDEQSGASPSNKRKNKSAKAETVVEQKLFKMSGNISHADSGGASRFFYVAKTSKRERNFSLDGRGRQTEHQPTANHHPTVKPIKLMQYLIKLITPPQGIVLDPFMGSGSTGCAAISLGFDFIGCELSEEYFAIAQKRIESHMEKSA